MAAMEWTRGDRREVLERRAARVVSITLVAESSDSAYEFGRRLHEALGPGSEVWLGLQDEAPVTAPPPHELVFVGYAVVPESSTAPDPMGEVERQIKPLAASVERYDVPVRLAVWLESQAVTSAA